jgi:hypothetical protein
LVGSFDECALLEAGAGSDQSQLDTFVVRTLVIPALFALIGPKIWWPSRTDDRAPQSPHGPAAAIGGRHRR